MRIISVLDTSIGNYNVGNEIITDSVLQELLDIFPDSFFYRIQPCDIGKFTEGVLNRSNMIVLGGTNALCGHMESYSQTDIERAGISGKVMLMGVGWWQYEKEVSSRSKRMLLHMLEKDLPLSVRDTYTKNRLEEIGFSNVLMTGCPTLWQLNDRHMRKIPQQISSETAIVTFTDYCQNPDKDRHVLEVVRKNYRELYAWAQGVGDFDYLTQELHLSPKYIIPPSLHKYDQFLADRHPDYIGTRLHGGIRALQKGCRAVIIANDNRAMEMKKDINLPVCTYEELESKINMPIPALSIPLEAITRWKKEIADSQYTEIADKIPPGPRDYDLRLKNVMRKVKSKVRKILLTHQK